MRAPVLPPPDRVAALDDEPLTLPAAWAPPPRPPVPVVAAIVPVVGAVALWLVTDSIYSLWFALLGPVIAAATVLDARRAARRDGRRAAADAVRARDAVAAAVTARHDVERAQLWARHPDVARLVVRDGDVWRAGRVGLLVVGEGERPSAVRVAGGDGDPDAAALRRRAARVSGAPVTIPVTAGVAVVGSETIAAAVQRALVLQLCLAVAPGELRIVGPAASGLEWLDELPHRDARSGSRLAVIGPGELVPADADIVIARCRAEDPPPPRCEAVLKLESPDPARLEHDGDGVAVRVEAVARAQAGEIAAELSVRAERSLGLLRDDGGPILLSSLLAAAPVDDPDARTATGGTAGSGGSASLEAVIGLGGGEPAIVDLVSDGPHAVVAGVTGSGKSELLITWILSLCATRSTDEVTFLLADFKGGTAFDGLAGVPHVTGVITDLDGSGARRAIESLRAELRRREATIAATGARDAFDARVRLARLVVVVDEFAALLGDHPELHALFADVAARGRALGIHLILGTQRAAGVIRDNLLANCPLRISLRVTDAADSRALLGTDDAAQLAGGAAGRGTAYLRRAGDAAPELVRIALSGPDDVAAAALRTGRLPPSRPWLPELPVRLTLEELTAHAAGDQPPVPSAALLLGIADEPERQRQPAAYTRVADRGLLVLGGPASGVSNALDVIQTQLQAQVPAQPRTPRSWPSDPWRDGDTDPRGRARIVRVPAGLEGLWDAVGDLHDQRPPAGSAILIDDLDAVALRFPPDYAQVVLERVEGLVRRAGDAGVLVVAGAHRMTGAVSRIAELFPRRLVLPYGTRVDHVGAGGDPGAYRPSAPPGRGSLDGRAVQLAHAPAPLRTDVAEPGTWAPAARLTGVVARRTPSGRGALAAWKRDGVRVLDLDAYVADPAAAGGGITVVAGEPDDWQRHWRLLADVRGDHDLVVDTSCAAELRVLAGFRGIPPFCEPGKARAWLIEAGADPVRIVLPRAEAPARGRSTG